MEFREALTEDLAFIVEVYNSTIAGRMATADLYPVSISEKKSWFEAHDQQHPIWIIEEHQQPIGWASLSKFHERPAYAASVEFAIYLHENCRGKGLGEKSLEILVEHARTLGYKSLIALIFAHNIPSIKIVTKAGFGLWGQLPGIARMDGKDYDLCIMGKHI